MTDCSREQVVSVLLVALLVPLSNTSHATTIIAELSLDDTQVSGAVLLSTAGLVVSWPGNGEDAASGHCQRRYQAYR